MSEGNQNIWYSTGIDNEQLKRDAAKSSAFIGNIGDRAEVESNRIDRSFKKVGSTIAALGGAVAFGAMAKELYSFANAFDNSMREVATISDTVTNNIESFKQQILELGTKVPIAADVAGKALYQIVSAGYDGADGMNLLEVSAKSAIAGMTDTTTAADAITTLLNAYKMSASEAANISDQLFMTAKLGKTTFGELGQSISQAAPIAASFGIETEQVLAAVATLTKSGTPTAQAMTQIRAAIIGASKELGDGYFKLHTFQEGLAEIAQRANGSESELRKLMPEIEGMNGVLGLTGLNAKMAASDLAALGGVAGETEKAFAKMSDTADAQLAILKNNMLKKFHEMGAGTLDVVGDIAKFLNNAFDSGAMNDVIATLGVLIATYGVYKTQLIATSAIQITCNNLLYQEEVAGLSLLLTKEASKNADIEKLLIDGKISKSQAEKVVLIRAEMQAQLNAMNVAATKAALMVRNAKAEIMATGNAISASRLKKVALEEELWTEIHKGNEQKANIVQEKIYAEAKNTSTLKLQLKTQQNALGALQDDASAKKIAANTLQQNLNNVSTNAGAKAKGLMTIATGRLSTAFKALGIALKTNPFGLILTGITLVISAMTMFGNKTKEIEGSTAEFTLKIRQEKSTFEELKTAIKQTAEGTEERANVIKLINERYPNYLSNILTEKSRTEDIISALTTANEKLIENIKLKLKQTQLEGILNSQLETETKFINDQVDWFKNIGNKSPEQIAIFTNKMADFVEKAREGKITVDDARKALIAFGTEKPENVEKAIISSDGRIARKLGILLKWSHDITLAADEAGNSQQILDALLKNTSSLDGNEATQVDVLTKKLEELKNKQLIFKDLITKNSGNYLILPLFQKSLEEINFEIDQVSDKLKKKQSEANGDDGGTISTVAKNQEYWDNIKKTALEARSKLGVNKQHTKEWKNYTDEIAKADKTLKVYSNSTEDNKTHDSNYEKLIQKQIEENEREKTEAIRRGIKDRLKLVEEDYKTELDIIKAARKGAESAAQKEKKPFDGTVFDTANTLTLNRKNDKLSLFDKEDADKNKEQIDTLLKEFETYQQKRERIEQEYNDKIAKLAVNPEVQAEAKRQKYKALSELDNAAQGTTSGISKLFQDMSKKSVQEMAKIANYGKDLLSFIEGDNAYTTLIDGTKKFKSDNPFGFTEAQYKTLKESPKDMEALVDQVEDLDTATQKTKLGFDKMLEGIEKVFNAGNDTKKLDEGLEQISGALQSVTVLGNLAIESLNNIAELSGNSLFSDIAEGLGTVLDVANKTMEGAKAGAQLGGATGAIVGAGLGLLSSITGIFAAAKKRRAEAAKERADFQLEELLGEFEITQQYRERYEWARKIGESELKHIKRKGEELTKQNKDNTADQKRLMALLQGEQYVSGIKWQKGNIFKKGKNVEEKQSLSGMNYNQIEALSAQGKLTEQAEQYFQALKRAKDEGADIAQMMLEEAERLRELTTGSSYESVVSGAMEILKRGTKSAAQTFDDIMKGAVESALNLLTDEKLRAWYEGFSKAGEDGYTADEKQYWKTEYERQLKQLEDDRKNLEDITGVKVGEGAKQQSATSKGFETMSQETGTKLEGTMSSLRNTLGISNEMVSQIKIQGEKMTQSAVYNSATLVEMKGLMFIGVEYLGQISKHTFHLIEMKDALNQVKINTSRL